MLPAATAPISPPNTPMLKTRPNAEAGRAHSVAMSGAANAIDWVSKPSSMATSAHSSTTPIWNRVIAAESSTCSKRVSRVAVTAGQRQPGLLAASARPWAEVS
jgi:hypothetical protein